MTAAMDGSFQTYSIDWPRNFNGACLSISIAITGNIGIRPGFKHSTGDWSSRSTGDLQNDPADIGHCFPM